MLLPYSLRLACLALFSMGTVQITLHLLLRFIRPLAGRSIDRMTARSQERIRFAIPVAPHLLALLLTLTVVIPQYIRNETNLLPERVGIVCFAGALAIAIRYLYAVLRASRLLRNKHEPEDAPVIMTAGLPVHLTAETYPQLAVTGLFSPRVILSQHLFANPAFSPELLEIALAHEKAHIRHFDNLKHLILLSLILPHEPAGEQWLQCWRHAAEIAADEDAVSGNSSRAIQLAETLLIAARTVPPQLAPELSLSLLQHEEDLDHRIHRLLRDDSPTPVPQPKRRRIIHAVALLAAGACVGFILIAASFPQLVEYVLHLG
jgi:beta-lactamase regulating signal transducer with metallopeptidase domain